MSLTLSSGCYAIDNEGAAEIDDAISVETLDSGQEKLWIHIADVGRWIRPGGPLSQEAERRMTSIYFPGLIGWRRVYPSHTYTALNTLHYECMPLTICVWKLFDICR